MGRSDEVGIEIYFVTFCLCQWEVMKVFCISFRLPGDDGVAYWVSERGRGLLGEKQKRERLWSRDLIEVNLRSDDTSKV